ncbi:MAG: hypothetical protein PHQ53_07720 [Candidatus Krumholzibacteria bacterium]|nr:hypothetical protein [Candidatus Krumholzibacteria bacterium]
MARVSGQHPATRTAVVAGLGCAFLLLAGSTGRSQPAAAVDGGSAVIEFQQRVALRDSLRQEIERYRELVRALQDSMAGSEGDRAQQQLWLADLENSVGSLGEVITAVTEQLAALQLEVDMGRVSLRDRHGGRVTVDLPPDLGERIGEGLASITRMILDEIPDTLHINTGRAGSAWSWATSRSNGTAPPAPQPERFIEGDIVKLSDDVEIAADEVVRGDVIAIFSEVRVKGRIQGDLVVVLGSVELAEGAAVDGAVTVVLGKLERGDNVQTGSLTVVNPGERMLLRDGGRLFGPTAWPVFGAWQGLFVLTVLLVLVLIVAVPRARLDVVVATVAARFLPSLGLGLLLVVLGHAAALGLSAILILTVIGIPVAVLLLLLLALLDLLAVGATAIACGRRCCQALGRQCRQPVAAVLIGLLILHLPALLGAFGGVVGVPPPLVLPLIWISRLIKILALAVGLGAFWLSRFGTIRRPEIADAGRLAPEAPQYPRS